MAGQQETLGNLMGLALENQARIQAMASRADGGRELLIFHPVDSTLRAVELQLN